MPNLLDNPIDFFKEGLSPLTAAIDGYNEAKEKAEREHAARQLGYECQLVENFNYSPKDFYVLLAKNLERRRIPGVEAGVIALRESIIGSPKRLYLAVGRERFVFYVCAAPFGSGFFFSWRFVDERRPAKWYHMIGAFMLTTFLSSIIYGVFMGGPRLFNVDSNTLVALRNSLSLLSMLLAFGAIWSAMRLASLPGYERFATFIERIPCIGRVFERFYRPDTYYREDTKRMYEKAFDYALAETIETVKNPQGVRHSGPIDGNPAVTDLHRR